MTGILAINHFLKGDKFNELHNHLTNCAKKMNIDLKIKTNLELALNIPQADFVLFWDKDTNILFAYQEVEGEEGSQDLGGNPIVQKWWDYMADIMEVNPDNSPVSIPLDERFYME